MNNSTKTALAVVIVASVGAGGAAVLADSPWLNNRPLAQAVEGDRFSKPNQRIVSLRW